MPDLCEEVDDAKDGNFRHRLSNGRRGVIAGTLFLIAIAIVTVPQRISNRANAFQKASSGRKVDLVEVFANLGADRLVDLSHTFDETTIYWPTDKPFRWEKRAWGPTANGYWYASANYAASEHGGTHLDSPIHFAEGRDTTEKITLNRLVGPALVIDVSAACQADPDHELTPEEILAWEKANGRIDAAAIVVVRTGWGKRWPDKKSYLGTDIPGDIANLKFPGISPKAAETLVSRGVKGVAIDTASLDRGISRDFATHRILTAANIYGIENLASSENLPTRGAVLIALPMKIGGGSGGPVRVMAVLPEH